MSPETPDAFRWMELAERFGVSFFALVMIGLAFVFFAKWAGPIIKEAINRQMDANEKRAEAAVLNAKAAVENSATLTSTAEKSLEIQKENADNIERMATVFESIVPILRRIDHAAFPNKKPPRK